MASSVGDAEAVDRFARVCHESAEALSTVGRRSAAEINRLIERDAWAGGRATQYRVVADNRRHELDRLADELHGLGRDLGRHCHWIQEREAHLYDLEKRIRRWAIQHPFIPGTPAMTPDASLVPLFPRRYSAEWETLAQRLRAHRAVF